MSPWQEYKRKLGESRPWDLLNPDEKVDDSIREMRYEVCATCPEFVSVTAQCRQCGCFMKLKTRLQSASCPIGKW